MSIRVTVWNEFVLENSEEQVRKVYPDGIHGAIRQGLCAASSDFEVSCAWLEKDEFHGLGGDVLDNTDVLIWWAHIANKKVRDDVVAKVTARVNEGMGLIVLHSAHMSKPFRQLLGTSCCLKWRQVNEKERVWTIEPSHPIALGLPENFVIPHTEMYGERFGIPTPKDLVFLSWYEGGEVFRSGVTFERGNGRIFYFSPGHEGFPIYFDENIRKVIANAVRWCAPRIFQKDSCLKAQPLEEIRSK